MSIELNYTMKDLDVIKTEESSTPSYPFPLKVFGVQRRVRQSYFCTLDPDIKVTRDRVVNSKVNVSLCNRVTLCISEWV